MNSTMRKTGLMMVLVLVFLLQSVVVSAATQIVVWHQEQPPNRVERFEEIAEAFNAQNPDIQVTVQVQDWNFVYQKLAAAASAGLQPDVIFVIPDFATTVRNLNLGQPVTDLVEELHASNQFIQAALDPYFSEDEFWAVPLYGMEQVLWYRKDIFNEAGIAGPPRTWEELVEIARTLTTEDRYGIAVPAGRNLASDQVIYSLMVTSGAKDLFDENGNVTFYSPETVRAFELYGQLLECSPPDATSYSWGEPQALFNSGRVAMAIEKGQYLLPFEDESGRSASDLGMARLPLPSTGGEEGTIYYSNAAMILAEDPAKIEAAKEFLRFILNDPEVYGEFLTAEPGLFLPVTQTGLQSQTFWNDPIVSKYRDIVEEIIAYSEYGALFGFTSGNIRPEIGAISQQNLLAQTVQQMVSGGMTAEEAVQWGQKKMEEAVAEYRSQ